MEKKRRTLVIYDIKDNKRRYRIIKVLESYGIRVQYSVFEAVLGENQWKDLTVRVTKYLKIDEDAFRMYDLSECKKETLIGQNIIANETDCVII